MRTVPMLCLLSGIPAGDEALPPPGEEVTAVHSAPISFRMARSLGP